LLGASFGSNELTSDMISSFALVDLRIFSTKISWIFLSMASLVDYS